MLSTRSRKVPISQQLDQIKLAQDVHRKRTRKQINQSDKLIQEQISTSQRQIEDCEQEDRLLNIPMECMGILSPQQRKKLKQQFSTMPAYLFMSQREKKKYFEKLSKDYKTTMQGVEQKKGQKKIKFKVQFQVKTFKDEQIVQAIGNKKCFFQKFKNGIHIID